MFIVAIEKKREEEREKMPSRNRKILAQERKRNIRIIYIIDNNTYNTYNRLSSYLSRVTVSRYLGPMVVICVSMLA